MRADRVLLYQQLEEARSSKVIAYVTGDRPGLETQIHSEVLDHFVHHLDLIGVTKRITLYLYTCGGNTLAAWSIVNLLRQFCDELDVIVPAKAQSGGTLICLGADTIVMTKQATLGPIDPSVNGPLNPQVSGAGPHARVPVSVEAINGFIEFAKSALGGSDAGMTAVLSQLSAQVHPLVLGNAYRSRAQIRMLAKRLVAKQLAGEEKVEKVLNFLCSESGSHDYTIFRREARDELGLKIEKPDDAGYRLIKAIYDDIAKELELTTPYDPNVVLGQQPTASYNFRRGLVESVAGGVHVHVSEGMLTKLQVPNPRGLNQTAIQDERTFEGWRHET
jgi:hypothetical protein